MIGLYVLEIDWGRHGRLEGLFLAEEEDVDEIIGKTVWFGEVLGKHSEVRDEMTRENLRLHTTRPEEIKALQDVFGIEKGTIMGYNPLHYYEGEEDE